MLLAMDTATQTASIALYDWQTEVEQDTTQYSVTGQSPAGQGTSGQSAENRGTPLLGEWTWLARRRQTQDLTSTVQAMLAHLGYTPAQVQALAVTTGPGSFTGVRIALSTAKGFALGASRPLPAIGIPVLAVTAAPWLTAAYASGARVAAYLQAGRGRFNWCLFDGRDPLWRPGVDDHCAGTLDEFVAAVSMLEGPTWLVGEETPALAQAIDERNATVAPGTTARLVRIDEVAGMRRAGHLAHLAIHHLKQGTCDEISGLQPLYLNQP